MQLQFETYGCPCLQRVVWQSQTTEETQEIKLSDGMPDIGRTLGAWGQPILRSKQWNSDSMQITGGIMAWVVYAPEDNSEIRSMETWIPFQLKWDLPKCEREGIIHVYPMVLNVDARTLSARKMMIRVNVGAVGEAMMPAEVPIPLVPQEKEGLEILTNRYPVWIPREAGEKNFLIEEDVEIKKGAEMAKLIACSLETAVTEEKVVGNKLAFRGNTRIHMLCRDEEGRLFSEDQELPFSQYTELDRDYGQGSCGKTRCCVTSLETDTREDGSIHLKCGLVAQYRILEEQVLELPEDGYCLDCETSFQTRELELPLILDQTEEVICSQQSAELSDVRVADVVFRPDLPEIRTLPEAVQVQLGGNYAVLYYDSENMLQSGTYRWQQDLSVPMDENGLMTASLEMTKAPQYNPNGNLTLRCDLLLKTQVLSRRGFRVIESARIGEKQERDPDRPSMILERAGTEGLWHLAKKNGSTVDAIRKANRLEEEPGEDRMLLIPVL